MGDWRLLFLHRDRIRQVDAGGRAARGGDVPQAVEPHGRPVRSDAEARPRGDPAAPDVAALLKDYKGDAAVAAGEAFDPSPANIETRTTRSRAAERAEARAAAEEDARRDGGRAR